MAEVWLPCCLNFIEPIDKCKTLNTCCTLWIEIKCPPIVAIIKCKYIYFVKVLVTGCIMQMVMLVSETCYIILIKKNSSLCKILLFRWVQKIYYIFLPWGHESWLCIRFGGVLFKHTNTALWNSKMFRLVGIFYFLPPHQDRCHHDQVIESWLYFIMHLIINN